MENGLTHFDEDGRAIMVDVTEKDCTERIAVAKGSIVVSQVVFDAIQSGTVTKGDVLGVARIAGIMATKRTPDLIPLCHPLLITKAVVDFQLDPETCTVEAVCTVKLSGKTGVEMEALTGVTVALLTIYDMCKAMDKNMELTGIFLEEKAGGKSGHYLKKLNEARMDSIEGNKK